MSETTTLVPAAELEDDFLSADDILSAPDTDTIIPITVPEWKGKGGKAGKLGLKVMSGDKIVAYLDGMNDPKKKKAAFIQLFAECAVDGKGRQLFPTPAAVAELRKKSAAIFLRLQRKLLEINGMGEKQRSWAQLKPILEEAGVDASVIAAVRAKWETAEDETKND